MRLADATIKGLITGFAMIALSLFLFYGIKLPVNGRDQFLVLTLYVAGIAWSLFTYKKNNTSSKSFKDYFATGFKTFIVVTLLMVIYTVVFYKFNTQIREIGIAENNELLVKEGNHTPAEIEKNATKIRSIFLPMMIGLTTFKYLIIGALVSAIGAGFLSQKKANA